MGDAPDSHLSPLQVSQKNCCRILFGDREAYIDKFKTCARTRPKGEQILGAEFFKREPTKPLMNKNSVLLLPNLYQYHSSLLSLKILKFRTPISIYTKFELSDRKTTLVKIPREHNSLAFTLGQTWNAVRTRFQVLDFSVKVGCLKKRIKKFLLSRQRDNDPEQWDETNFGKM